MLHSESDYWQGGITMKLEQGVVLELIGDEAKIKVGRHSDCSNCGGCAGAQHIIIDALNPADAQVGQRVEFELKEANVIVGAFTVFITPLIAAFIGATLGWYLGGKYGYNVVHSSIAAGIIVFLLSLVWVKLFDRSVAADQKSKPRITRILE